MADRTSLLARLRLALAAALALGARPAAEARPAPEAPSVPLPVPPRPETADTVPLDWLDRRISVDEAEAEHPGITDERVGRFPEAARPFGFQNPRWEALKSGMRPGDELWTFASPVDSWRHLAGRAGIALLRDHAVVDAMVTMMN